ncbi:MAG: protein kinase [bacterium]
MWICPECRTLYKKARKQCDRDDAPLAEVQAHQVKARYPLLGKVVGDRYHLIGGLGQGGLGTVYLAQHLHLEQLFAVKFLDLETVGLDVGKDQKEEYSRDFMKEARIASVIRHDAVVRVSDFGIYEKMPFLVMDYVPGPSLLQMLAERGRFEVPEAINIARRIADALGSFHERRLVHRDLKPANVILDPRGDGRLTLVDLGLVKDISGHGGRASTHPMALRGTPGYLAPEQVPSWVLSGIGAVMPGEKRLVDGRVDLYALGVLFYEMIAGVSPYPDGSNTQIIVWACTKDPLPLTGVDPPIKLLPGLEQLIYDTMARDPEKRPASAQAFIERLDEVAMGPAIQGSWPVMVVPGMRQRRSSGPLPSTGLDALLPKPASEPPSLPPDTELMPPDKAFAAASRAQRAEQASVAQRASAPRREDLPFTVDDESADATQKGGALPIDSMDGLLEVDDSAAEMPTAVQGYLDDDDDMAPTQVEPLTGPSPALAFGKTRVQRVDALGPEEEEPTRADMAPPSLSAFRLGESRAPAAAGGSRRRWLMFLALPIVALATGLGVWALVGGDDDEVAPGRLTIGSGAAQPEAAPEVAPTRPEPERVIVQPIVQDAALPLDASVEAAPQPGEERPASPQKRPRAEAPARRKVPDRELLLQAQEAHKAQDYAQAVALYEQWLKRFEYLVPPHPQYNSVQSRLHEARYQQEQQAQRGSP